MVDKKKQDPFEEQGQHRVAREILRREYNDEIKRASAQHLNAVYAQSQIDYDQTHEHASGKDIPKFEKVRDEAKAALAGHEERAMELRESLKALGEVFLDEDAKHGKQVEQQ